MLEPDQTTFIILSFEGPDVYSQAGGLGVRVKELSRALAERGFETHLFFVGDPASAFAITRTGPGTPGAVPIGATVATGACRSERAVAETSPAE